MFISLHHCIATYPRHQRRKQRFQRLQSSWSKPSYAAVSPGSDDPKIARALCWDWSSRCLLRHPVTHHSSPNDSIEGHITVIQQWITIITFNIMVMISGCLWVFMAAPCGLIRFEIARNLLPVTVRLLAGCGDWPGSTWVNKVVRDSTHRIHGAAIYGNIYHQYTPNVSIYSIHGSYGVWMDGTTWCPVPVFFLVALWALSKVRLKVSEMIPDNAFPSLFAWIPSGYLT